MQCYAWNEVESISSKNTPSKQEILLLRPSWFDTTMDTILKDAVPVHSVIFAHWAPVWPSLYYFFIGPRVSGLFCFCLFVCFMLCNWENSSRSCKSEAWVIAIVNSGEVWTPSGLCGSLQNMCSAMYGMDGIVGGTGDPFSEVFSLYN